MPVLPTLPRTLSRRLELAAITDVGAARESNEDGFAVYPSLDAAVVLDGQGSFRGLSIGVYECVTSVHEVLCSAYRSAPKDVAMLHGFSRTPNDPQEQLFLSYAKGVPVVTNDDLHPLSAVVWSAIATANRRLYEGASKVRSFRGIGAAVAMLAANEHELVLAHVGDARIYRLRDTLEQLTEDHSLLSEYVRKGQVRRDEVKNFPHANVITRALGLQTHVGIDLQIHLLQRGDVYLACTDGVVQALTAAMIKKLLERHRETPSEACAAFRKAVYESGRANDNFTVCVARVR